MILGIETKKDLKNQLKENYFITLNKIKEVITSR